MAQDYTTTALLASIKTRGLIPTSQRTFADIDLLTLANEELQIGIVPFMMKNRSEYFVTDQDQIINANQNNYTIPTRAIGGKVRGLVIVDSSGNEYDMPQIQKEDRRFYNTQSSNSGFYSFVFFFEGNDIILVPTPTQVSQASIRFGYYERPNQLILPTSAAQISSVNFTTNQITVSTVPSSINTSVQIDFIKGKPGFENKAIDQTILGIAGPILTFSSLPPNLIMGDYIAPSEQSPFPQIPLELHSMLAQRTVVKVMEGLGDIQGLQTAQSKLREMEDAALHILSSRSDGNPKKLVNRYSPLRTWGNRGFTRY